MSDPESKKLNDLIAAYLQAQNSDEKLARQELISRNPDLAAELRSFFRDHDAIRTSDLNASGEPPTPSLEDPTIPPSAAEPPTIGPNETGTPRILQRDFGEYELLEEIARGGMGVVFKARQTKLNRIVALKMILAGQLASESDVRRFYTEAEAAAGLDHPGIVPVFEVGEHAGQHFFSMGFVDGKSLAEKLRDGPLAPRAAAALISQVAEAVSFAHARGVIHRDLKPANVLLESPKYTSAELPNTEEDIRARITDFGLAKRVERSSDLTSAGQILGTPSYMPPEQAAGNVDAVSERSDVYSLGAVLYACLTGRPPFQAHTQLDTLMQVLDEPPAEPRELNPRIPRDLETICLKCLEKDAARRYQTAGELSGDLERFLTNEPIRARRVGLAERTWRWLRKQGRSVAITSGAVAASAVLLLLAVTVSYSLRQWQAGYLTIRTDHPGLIATVLEADGDVAAPASTLPTTETLKLPANDYRIRLSGRGRLSRTFAASLPSREQVEMELNLEDQLLWPSREIERSLATVQIDGRATQIYLTDAGLERIDAETTHSPWQLDLKAGSRSDSQGETKTRGLVWPWYIANANQSGRGQFDQRPWILSAREGGQRGDGAIASGFDLNADGHDDFVIAARHQAWLVAVSAIDGHLLWFAPRGSDVTEQSVGSGLIRSHYGELTSAVLAMPQVVGDLNGDNVVDLVVSMVDVGSERETNSGDTTIDSTAPGVGRRRWVEVMSGKTGQAIWTCELNDSWFDLPDGGNPPIHTRWFHGGTSVKLSSSGAAISGRSIVRTRVRVEREGAFTFVQTEPLLASGVRQSGRDSLIVLMAGSHLVTIEPTSGELVGKPTDLGLQPCRAPQVAHLDDDGQPDLVLVANDQTTDQRGRAVRSSRLLAWSLSQRRSLWEQPLNAEHLPRPTWSTPGSNWPVLKDIDGDGTAELLVPVAATSRSRRLWGKGWGELQLLNGATGAVHWSSRLKNVEPQLDRFTFGPDLNEDGYAEVFVATLLYTDTELFVDCLSGRDGTRLWWGRTVLGGRSRYSCEWWIGKLRWWQSCSGDWPTLVVEVFPDSNAERRAAPSIHLFSAGTGESLGTGTDLEVADLADLDGDTVDDLVAVRPWRAFDSGGMVDVISGSWLDLWRRLSDGSPQAAPDLDGDEVSDVLIAQQGGFLQAVSGQSGQLLWTSRSLASGGLGKTTSLGDLNRDDSDDLLVSATSGSNRGAWSPFVALSGRDGRVIWRSKLRVRRLEAIGFAGSADLENDGSAEIVVVAQTDYGGPQRSGGASVSPTQLSAFVFDGSDGTIRWHKRLSGADADGELIDEPFGVTWSGQTTTLLTDLGSDGQVDVVTVAHAAERDEFELRALDGRNGDTLWSHPLQPAERRGDELTHSTCSAVDFNGDGNLDVLLAERTNQKLTALDGSTGQELWHWTPDGVWNEQIRSSDVRWLQPQLATAPDQRPLVCVPLWGASGAIVGLNHEGKQVWQHSLSFAQDQFQVLTLDVNGDASEELLIRDAHKLTLMKHTDSHFSEKVWEQQLRRSSVNRILEVTSQEVPTIIIQENKTGSLFGFDGASGALRWEAGGLRPRYERSHPKLDAIPLLRNQRSSLPPLILFGYRPRSNSNVVSICMTPRLVHAPNAGVNRRARLDLGKDDPRQLRELPWVTQFRMQEEEWAEMPVIIAWTAMISMFMVVAPGAYFGRLLQRRSWSLITLLLAPIVIALMLVVLTVPAPTFQLDRGMTLPRRVGIAFGVAPWLLYPILLVAWAAQRRWLRILFWLCLAVIASIVPALVMLQVDSNWSVNENRYTWNGWYVVVGFGIYVSGLLMVVVGLATAVIRRWRSRRRRVARSLLGAQS